MGVYEWFKVILVIQLFYGFGITLLMHAWAQNAGFNAGDVEAFETVSQNLDIQDTTNQIQQNFNTQFQLNGTDLAGLIYYSGNLLLDLLVNTAFAAPQMFTIILTGLFSVMTVDAFIQGWITAFFFTIVSILYFLSLLQFLLTSRTGRTVV